MDVNSFLEWDETHFAVLWFKGCRTYVDFDEIGEALLVHSLGFETTPDIDHVLGANSRKRVPGSEDVVLELEGSPLQFQLAVVVIGFELIDID